MDIGDLFCDERCPGGLGFVFFLLYFPIGLLLSILRFFIGLHAFLVACVLPKTSVLRGLIMRGMCGVLGIIVTQEGTDNRNKSAKVLVANYTSTLDHLAVDLVAPNILPCVWALPPTLMRVLGYTDMGVKEGRQVLVNNARKHCIESELPILAFPEGASTNGRVGLLKFSVWPFSLGMSVQPLVIKLSRPPFARAEPSILGGRWWIDIFWFLFSPYTNFHIRTLPVAHKEEEESEEEFSSRVQKQIASELGVFATNHSSADKVEYAKRRLLERTLQQNTSGNNNRPSGLSSSPLLTSGQDAASRMSLQVKEVLPHVPLSAITRDLALTKDVDLTITNILEGRVKFEPEEPGSSSDSRGSATLPPAPSPAKASVAAQTFSKNSQERHLSLSDRKRNLIESARQRYREKHGML